MHIKEFKNIFNEDWSLCIPSLNSQQKASTIKENLQNLQHIVLFILKNRLSFDLNDHEKFKINCNKFIQCLPDNHGKTILKIHSICNELLFEQDNFEIKFLETEKSYRLSSGLKEALCSDSLFFKILFRSGFLETEQKSLILQNLDVEEFRNLISDLYKDTISPSDFLENDKDSTTSFTCISTLVGLLQNFAHAKDFTRNFFLHKPSKDITIPSKDITRLFELAHYFHIPRLEDAYLTVVSNLDVAHNSHFNIAVELLSLNIPENFRAEIEKKLSEYILIRTTDDFNLIIRLLSLNISETLKLRLEQQLSYYFFKFERNEIDEKIKLLNQSSLKNLSLQVPEHSTKQHLKNLRKITLHTSLNFLQPMKDDDLKELKDFLHLSSLDLSNCSEITDKALEYLKDLPNLTSLDLFNCNGITDKGLEHFKGLVSLTSLNLSECRKITDKGLEYLKDLPNLTSLDLTNCKKITDKGLEHLKSLLNLTSLNLAYCMEITDRGLEHLKSLLNLTSLNLSNCREITDKGIKYLKSPNLNSLNLNYCLKTTNKVLKHLKDFPNLNLDFAKILQILRE